MAKIEFKELMFRLEEKGWPHHLLEPGEEVELTYEQAKEFVERGLELYPEALELVRRGEEYELAFVTGCTLGMVYGWLRSLEQVPEEERSGLTFRYGVEESEEEDDDGHGALLDSVLVFEVPIEKMPEPIPQEFEIRNNRLYLNGECVAEGELVGESAGIKHLKGKFPEKVRKDILEDVQLCVKYGGREITLFVGRIAGTEDLYEVWVFDD